TLDEVRHRIVTYAVVALPPTTKSPPEGLPQEIKLRRPDLGLIIALVTTEAKLMAELFHTTGRPWDCLKCSVYIQRFLGLLDAGKLLIGYGIGVIFVVIATYSLI
ncbi:hypothetical protein Tco_0618550, partial [Tanacetum coccineum]